MLRKAVDILDKEDLRIQALLGFFHGIFLNIVDKLNLDLDTFSLNLRINDYIKRPQELYFVLHELLRREAQTRILELRANIDWKGDLGVMRQTRSLEKIYISDNPLPKEIFDFAQQLVKYCKNLNN